MNNINSVKEIKAEISRLQTKLHQIQISSYNPPIDYDEPDNLEFIGGDWVSVPDNWNNDY